MRIKSQTRYAILLCTVVFALWIVYWPRPIVNVSECNGKITSCPYTDLAKLDDKAASSSEENYLIGKIGDEHDQKVRDEGYDKYAFNEFISSRIGYNRQIPDTRHNVCKSLSYSDDLPTATVVICFHNEAWFTLLRTVYSILNRTPKHLLHEIILVDDLSTDEHLKEALENHVKYLNKVSIVRATKREGLIRGRALGASKARGDILVFLDSHCEVNVNWLPPLLEPISKNSQTVVCPVIDIINPDTFQYCPSPLVKGGFNWGLNFQWEPISPSIFEKPEDFTKPIKSPTMAGGLFAIHNNYFNVLGKYDNGMEIWGGENLEISFRIWMCGGELKIIPCSRVGHVFRNRRPYGGDGKGDSMAYNSMRVAEVWMDEYKKYFYDVRKELKGQNFGDIRQRQELRRKLKCRTFKWFLYNVYTEIDIPLERKGNSLIWQRRPMKKMKILQEGKLQNSLGFCLDVPAESIAKGIRLVLRKCSEVRVEKIWTLNDAAQLRLHRKLCVGVKKQNTPRLMKCHEEGGSQQWIFIKGSQSLYNPASGTCLSQSLTNKALMVICNKSDLSQRWKFKV